MAASNQIEQVQNKDKLFPIILKENQAMPLQQFVEIEKNKGSKPITPDDSSLCSHLSKRQQLVIKKSMENINSFHTSYGLELTKETCESQKEEALKTFCKFTKTVSLASYIPSFLLGAEEITQSSTFFYDAITQKKVEKSGGEANNTIMETQVQEGTQKNQVGMPQVNEADQEKPAEIPNSIREVTFCLIYNGESKEELIQTIIRLNQQKLTESSEDIEYSQSIFILVCGNTNFEKIFANLLGEQDFDLINQFLQNYGTSVNYGYFIEKEDFIQQSIVDGNSNSLIEKQFQNQKPISIFFIILPTILDRVQVQRWIFQGISKLVDPTYLIVSNSNQEFDKSFLYECLNRIHEKEEYFGLQWKKQYDTNFSSIEARILNNDNLIRNDSIFGIKKFHDPLHCVYKWQSVSNLIEKYFNDLDSRKQSDDICFCENSIFTSLIFDMQGQKLFYLDKVISKIKDKNEDLHSQISIIGEKYYNCQLQLNQQFSLTREYNQTLSVELGLLVQRIVGKIMNFVNCFNLSIILCFSFLNPYQLLKYAFDSRKGYFVLAFLLPAVYCFTLISILLLSQSYQINNKLKEKQVCLKKENQYFKLSKSQSNIDQTALTHFITQNGFQLVFTNNISGKIQKRFKFLFFITYICDISIVLFTIFNVFFLYGYQMSNVTFQNIFVIVVAIITIIIFAFEGWICGCYQFTKLLLISKYYVSQSKKYSSEIQIRKKKDLAFEFSLNFFAYLIFIILAVYFEFTGYALLSLLAIIIFIKILEYTMLILIKIKNKFQQKNSKANFVIQDQQAILNSNGMNKNFMELIKIVNKFKGEKITEENELQGQIKLEYKKKQKELLQKRKEQNKSKGSGVDNQNQA